MPPQKPRLKQDTKQLIRKRREWRERALNAALEMTTWPAGKPGRDKCETEVVKCFNKVREWFRAPRGSVVVNAIQRRAINAFRNQQ